LVWSGDPTMPPRFLYFDLGNVLLHFDHRRGARQMAAVAGIEDPEVVWRTVFASDLEQRYEAGALSSREFYEHFCDATGSQPAYDALACAAGDIFEVNVSVKAVLAALAEAGQRLGLLSNTNEVHWNHFASGRYALLPDVFETEVLSFRERSMKPEEKIFRIAAERAGCRPEEIFYVDDTVGHVEAARRLGFDAVPFTTTPQLVRDLRARGVEFNY
jgi:putative hydrolase of the HAD superfamily